MYDYFTKKKPTLFELVLNWLKSAKII